MALERLVQMAKQPYNNGKGEGKRPSRVLNRLRGVTLSDRRSIRPQLVTGVITLFISFLLLFATGAWASKVDRETYIADMQKLDSKVERVLDLLCVKSPEARQCQK
jgi:hypothetical protein